MAASPAVNVQAKTRNVCNLPSASIAMGGTINDIVAQQSPAQSLGLDPASSRSECAARQKTKS